MSRLMAPPVILLVYNPMAFNFHQQCSILYLGLLLASWSDSWYLYRVGVIFKSYFFGVLVCDEQILPPPLCPEHNAMSLVCVLMSGIFWIIYCTLILLGFWSTKLVTSTLWCFPSSSPPLGRGGANPQSHMGSGCPITLTPLASLLQGCL